MNRLFSRFVLACIGMMLASPLVHAQGRTELGVADSFVVQGTTGTKADPDVVLSGYTLFGTNAAAAFAVTSGVGNVYIQNSLEIGSKLHLRGSGVVYPDGSTQSTAYVVNTNAVPLLSGECDTNRLDILVSTNYVITAVKAFQAPVVPQFVRVYANGVEVDNFVLSAASATHPVSINLVEFDRLGIACTNLSGTVLFSVEGRRL